MFINVIVCFGLNFDWIDLVGMKEHLCWNIRLVVLETGLGLKTGLKTTFLWSWSCHGLDSLWSRSCLGLGSLGLAMSRTGRAVSKGFCNL